MFGNLIQNWKAWRRGEVRVKSGKVRGRVFAKKSGEDSRGGAHRVGAKATANLEIKITRADGTVEKQTIPARIRR